MSDFSKTGIDAVEALVHTTWSDCGTLYRVSAGSWINWRDQIKAGNMSVPFAVLQALPETNDPDWGTGVKTYRQAFAIYYVRSATLSAGEKTGGATHAEDLIYPKVSAMRDALLANVASFQVVEDPSIDVGDTNPANQVFSENGDNFWAGSVTGWGLIGETYQ